MIKTTTALFSILAISSSFLQPRDLVDEAQDQLDQLQALVEGEITVAHNQLQYTLNRFNLHRVDVTESAYNSIQMQHRNVLSQVTTIKDLAQAAGKDISSCTDIREDSLNGLANDHQQVLFQCMNVVSRQAITLTNDAKYRVDIFINNVHNLEFQFKQCRGELLCISPILSEIELDKIRLPQNIGIEVQAVESLLTTMRLSVRSCSDDGLAEFATEINTILGEIEACVNKILG